MCFIFENHLTPLAVNLNLIILSSELGQKSLGVDISMKIGKNFSYKENVAKFESRIRVEFGCVKAKFSRVRKKKYFKSTMWLPLAMTFLQMSASSSLHVSNLYQ